MKSSDFFRAQSSDNNKDDSVDSSAETESANSVKGIHRRGTLPKNLTHGPDGLKDMKMGPFKSHVVRGVDPKSKPGAVRYRDEMPEGRESRKEFLFQRMFTAMEARE